MYAKQRIEAEQGWGDLAPKPPLYGIYNVQTFVRNGDTIPPLTTDTTRWKKLIVNYPQYARLYQMNDSTQSCVFEVDTVQQNITMYPSGRAHRKYQLSYDYATSGLLTLDGTFGPDSVTVVMQSYDLDNYLLVRRGFHWINESPFNR